MPIQNSVYSGRIIADPYESAVLIEYTVETIDRRSEQVRLQQPVHLFFQTIGTY